MFSRLKHQLQTFLPLGAGLLIVGLVTVLGGLWNYQNELDAHLAAKPAPVLELASQKTAGNDAGRSAKAAAGSNHRSGKSVGSPTVTASAAGAQSGQTLSSSAPGSSSRSAAATKQNAAIISVSLSINGQTQGRVRVASGSTQCDVLSQALAQGVIHSLDMRYNSQWGTEGVYVVNGIGDPNVVWWTYTVNGSAPPYGCGYVTVHDGDSVNWRYVKG